MKMSIIIPAYNEEFYIGRCLQSVLEAKKHSANEIEIIVVNNNSTDRTRQVAASYPGVIVIDELRKGTNMARQAGFAKSTGQLIANIDADCYLPKGWLEKAFAAFQKNPRLAAFGGPYVFYDLSPAQNLISKTYYYLAYPAYVLGNKLKFRGAMMGGNMVIRRTALEQIGGYNTALTFYGDDSDTVQRLAKTGDVKFSYKFYIYSSARRLKAEGAIASIYHYVMNYVWLSLFKRPFNISATEYREQTSQLKKGSRD